MNETTNTTPEGPSRRRTFSYRTGGPNRSRGGRRFDNKGRGPGTGPGPTRTGERPAGPSRAPSSKPGEKREGGGSRPRRSNSRFPNKRRSNKAPALQHRISVTDERAPKLPEIMDDDTVRIIPISGVEEIGRNM